MKDKKRHTRTTRIFVGALASVYVAAASPMAPAQTVSVITIQPQPLGSALKSLAAQTSMQLLYAEADVQGKAAAPVTAGTVDEALASLLRGTNLEYVMRDQKTIIVRPATAPPPPSRKASSRTVPGSGGDPVQVAAAGAAVPGAPAGSASVSVPPSPPAQSETITVTGIRASLQKSLEIKRNADAFVDAISSEEAGKFPDKNVAESLSRIPGVTISHLFGDGEQVSIEGTDPSLNRTLLNGETVASGDWFILDALTPTRSFNYTLLPSQVTSNLEVYKSPEAEMDEGSIGGTVIIHTPKPLDLDPWKMNFAADGNYNDRAGKAAPDFSGLISWHNDDKTFGVVVAAVRDDEYERRDGIETFGYTPTAIQFANASAPVAQNIAVPDGINAAYFQQERIQTGGVIGVQAKPTAELEVNFTGFANQGQYNNVNQSYYVQPATIYPGAPLLAGKITDGALSAASFGVNPGGPGSVEDDIYQRDATVMTYASDLRLDYRTDSWHASVEGGYTRATGGTQGEYGTSFTANVPFSYSIAGGVPTVTLPFNTKDPTQLGTYIGGTYDAVDTFDKEAYIQADYEHDLDLGPLNAIKFGVKYRDHANGVNGWGTDNLNTDPNNPVQPAVPFNLGTVTTGLIPSNFLNGVASPGMITSFPNANLTKQQQFLTTGTLIYSGTPASDFVVQEKIASAYGQIDFSTSQMHGNIGVRYVHTDQEANFYNVTNLSCPLTPTNFTGSCTDATPVSASHPYNDILPSFNVAFDLSSEVVLRVAAAEVMARDNYSDLAGAVNLDPTTHTGTRGNPDLQPYHSANFDISNEWYMDKNSMLAGAVFYKEIQSYVVDETDSELDQTIGFDKTPVPYLITHPLNGGGGRNEGLELQFQHDIWNGFGAVGSYTYSYAIADDGGQIPGNSRHAYSITGYYDKDDLSARISYTYRTAWFLGNDYSTPQFNAGEGELDFSTTYNITDNYGITFDAVNLTDVTTLQYDQDPSRPTAIYKNGRKFRLGVKAVF